MASSGSSESARDSCSQRIDPRDVERIDLAPAVGLTSQGSGVGQGQLLGADPIRRTGCIRFLHQGLALGIGLTADQRGHRKEFLSAVFRCAGHDDLRATSIGKQDAHRPAPAAAMPR